MGSKEGKAYHLGVYPELFFASRTSFRNIEPKCLHRSAIGEYVIRTNLFYLVKIQSRFFVEWGKSVGRLRRRWHRAGQAVLQFVPVNAIETALHGPRCDKRR